MTKTDDLIRRRFHELGATVEAIRARAKPTRDEYEAISVEINALEERRREIAGRLKIAEAGLFEAMQEHAHAARALRPPGELVAKTGPKPEAA